MATLRTEQTAEGIRVWDDRDPDTPVYLHRAKSIDPATIDRVLADRARLRADAEADARWDAYAEQARQEIEAVKAQLGPARLTMTDAQIRQQLLGTRKTVFSSSAVSAPLREPVPPSLEP